MTRVRGVPAKGMVAGLALVALAACSDAGPTSESPRDTASPQASASPAIIASAAPTPSPAPSGFLPAASLGQSDVPWDELGYGWFLVAWDGPPPPNVDEYVAGPSPAGFSLVSPDATVYALADLGIVDAAWVIDWRVDEVGVVRNPDLAEGDTGDVATINLRTGAENAIVSRGQIPMADYVAANGDLVGSQFYGDLPVPVFAYRDYRPVGKICDGNGGGALMSPDGVRVVCLTFDPADDEKTAVVIGRVDEVGSPKQIDVFQASPYLYSVLGWLDADTFILERRSQTYGDPSTFFTYDIATRTIANYTVPVPYDADPLHHLLPFDFASQTFAVSRPGTITFYGVDGSVVADVTCATSGDNAEHPGVVRSGAFALVTCLSSPIHESSASLDIVDLRTGVTTHVGTFDQTIDSRYGGAWPLLRRDE